MVERPAYDTVLLSMHLSRVLDEIGANERTVQNRRLMALQRETLMTFLCDLNKANLGDIYAFGSQSEGSTTVNLKPDHDIVRVLERYNVMQDRAEWQKGKMNLLMLHEDTMPGYCRLQAFQSDVPLPTKCLPSDGYKLDNCQRVIMKQFELANGEGEYRNGPAIGRIFPQQKADLVPALRCYRWHLHAAQWIDRHRCGQWPTQQLIDQAVNDSIFLVGVGYKLSQTQDLEWRISFSLTERRLMFSMNMTQIKCYIVLKMVMKSFVCPHVGESISSYHCKTAMFYCMEDTDSEYWRDGNLLQCIVKCLELLLTWVNNEFCPHFILPKANLFAGKINSCNKYNIQCILEDLIESNGRFLLCLHTDELGYKLAERLGTRPIQVQVLDSPQTMLVAWQTEVSFANFMEIYHRVMSPLTQNMLMKHVYQNIHSLIARRMQVDETKKQAEQTIFKFFSVWLGSLLASVSFSYERRIPRTARHWLGFGINFDTSSVLKLASIFYCGGELRNTESTLKEVAERYRTNNIMTICGCYNRDYKYPEDECFRAALFTHCVRFSHQEKYCTPPALRHELCRSVGDDMLHRDPVMDDWMVFAVVDCLPFLYYLQYITYGELRKRALQKEALQNLEKCLVEDNNFGHLETGLNLLRQCKEQEVKPEDAMRCY